MPASDLACPPGTAVTVLPARSRVVPVTYEDYAPSAGLPVMAGEKQAGMFGSSAKGHGLAMVRLDRIEEALASGAPITAGGIAIRPVKPDWATFAWPGEAKAKE